MSRFIESLKNLFHLNTEAPAQPAREPVVIDVVTTPLDAKELRKLEQKIIRNLHRIMHDNCYHPPAITEEPAEPFGLADAARQLLGEKPKLVNDLLRVSYTALQFEEYTGSALDGVLCICVRVIRYIALQDPELEMIVDGHYRTYLLAKKAHHDLLRNMQAEADRAEAARQSTAAQARREELRASTIWPPS